MGLFDNQDNYSGSIFSFDPSNPDGNSTPVYDAPVAKNLDSNQAYDQALKYNQFAQDQALSGQSVAANQALSQSIDALKAKSGIESQQKLTDATNAASFQNKPGGTGSSSFGKGAFQPSGYSTNAYGQRSLYNAGAVADWGLQQMSAIKSARDYSKAEAAGQIELAEKQSQENARMRTNELLKQQNQNAFQLQQGMADRASQERIASLQSQAGIANALFGNIGQRRQTNFWN